MARERLWESANTLFYANTFIKAPGTPAGVKPLILGDGGNAVRDIGFFSNSFQGWTDLFEYHSNSVAYSCGWTLTVQVMDRAGKPKSGAEVVVTDKDGAETLKQTTDEKGAVTARLAEFKYAGGRKNTCSSYTVKSGASEARIDMKKDANVTLKIDY